MGFPLKDKVGIPDLTVLVFINYTLPSMTDWPLRASRNPMDSPSVQALRKYILPFTLGLLCVPLRFLSEFM